MSNTIQKVITKEDIKESLSSLGITSGMIVEVHANYSSLKNVLGGARTIVDALLETLSSGTIIMPLEFKGNSEPSEWDNPSVSPNLWEDVRNNIPSTNPLFSDLSDGDEIVEAFRKRDDVVFSNHPYYPFVAWGKYAKLLCNRQSTHFPLADESPIARLYELKGKVLLIGCDFSFCSCMYLAEYHNETRPIVIKGANKQTANGDSKWKEYLDLDLDTKPFIKIGEIMHKKSMIQETNLESCKMQFFNATDAIDEASKYFEKSVVYDLYR